MCADGNIRLIGSSKPSFGRLEVFYKGMWGTVCSHGFDGTDALTVCNILGFNNR